MDNNNNNNNSNINNNNNNNKITINDITTEILDKVEFMAAFGATLKMIAAELNVCERTIRNWRAKNPELDASYKRGVEKGNNRILQTAFKQATNGNITMLIFLMKTRLKMSERPVIDLGGAKLSQIVDIIIDTVKDPEELKKIESRMREIDFSADDEN